MIYMENMELNKLFENTLYINLDHRKDRNEHIIKQLNGLGIQNYTRISAVDMTKENAGADVSVGCTLSHIKCLEYAKEKEWEYVFICEDDLRIIDLDLLKTSLNNLLKDKSLPNWNVLLLVANLFNCEPPNTKISENIIRVRGCYCASGYVIKRSYYDTLISCALKGLKDKIPMDVSWHELQKLDTFIIPYPPSVTQGDLFYSDIEKQEMNYTSQLLDFNKGLS